MSLRSIDRKFYAADNVGGGNIPVVNLDDKELNKDSIYDALGDDNEVIELDDKKPSKGKEDKTKEIEATQENDEEIDDSQDENLDEEVDELDELERELDGPKEEQLELVTPVRRKEILAKYPKLFQDFPYLEKAYYREQQFTEIYPTIDDAKAALEKSQSLEKFEGQLLQGNTEELLKAIRAENEGSFHQIVDNYLVALYNTDQSAYYHILGNINKMTIAQMVDEGKRSNNEALISAATILNQFIFGNTQWTPPSKLSKTTVNPEKDNVSTERQQFLQERYEIVRDDLSTRLENALQATIEQNIDKQGVMTPYVKQAAVKDALKLLQKLVNSDSRFQALQKKMWQSAANEKFSKASTDIIYSAFKTKAKVLLPDVLKRARNEALKGMGKRVKDDTQDVNDGSTRNSRPNQTRSTTTSRSGQSHSEQAKKIPKGMTTLEFLNSD